MNNNIQFQFKEFSKKQRMLLNWWSDASPVKDKNGIIADGAIRSGKTVCLSLSFVMWAMYRFNDNNFALCGKTIGALRRNVVEPLKIMLNTLGYQIQERRAENTMNVTMGSRTNHFYFFGGKDESSQDLVQGLTLAGVFFDEVALMPESFVNQATARCSVEGSKWFFNCNPEGPQHWFYRNWIIQNKERNTIHLHFDLDDNLTLTEEIKDRYRHQYSGVFYERYVLGKWVMAEGIIYDMFDKKKHVKPLKEITPLLTGKCYISCDYGTQNPTVFKMWQKGLDGIWYCIDEYYYSGREEQKQKTDNEYVTDMGKFVAGRDYKEIVVDPSAASFIAALRQAGYRVRKAKNDVLNGIREVGVRLNLQKIMYADVCKHTIAEYGLYRWSERAIDRGEDIPLKENDHCMDADRYFVYTELNHGNKVKVKGYGGGI